MGKRGGERQGAAATLRGFYTSLLDAFGPQGWWPGRTRFEVIVGAILTQNTAWTNVERAIRNLRKGGLLTPAALHASDLEGLAEAIRPAGYFNIKARRLKNFTGHLFDRHGGSLDRLFRNTPKGLRSELLEVNGVGPETADSIVLYAAGMAEFVVDAYTVRIFARHGLVDEGAGYDEVKALFMDNLPADPSMFNEYHALIVKTGKDYCRPRNPKCGDCPLGRYLQPRP